MTQVERIVNLLSKAAKNYQVYLPNNRLFLSSLKLLKESLDQYFNEETSLPLEVTEFELLYDDEVVYCNTDKNQSLAFRMYRDGVRLICFHRGIAEQEIIEFLEALDRATDVNNLDEDFVTILWEKDLRHITYYEVEDYEDLEFGEGASDGKQSVDGAPPGECQAVVDATLREDVDKIKKMLQVDMPHQVSYALHLETESPGLFLKTVWDVVRLTLEEKWSSDFRTSAANPIAAIIETAIVEGEIGVAAEILDEVKKYYLGREDPESSLILSQIIDRLISRKLLSLIGQELLGSSEVAKEKFYLLLCHLGPQALRALVELGAEQSTPPVTETIVRSIATIAENDPTLIVDSVDPTDAAQCEIALGALERIGSPAATEAALKLAQSPSSRIRARVITLATKGDPAKAVNLANQLLHDPDPLVKRRSLLALVEIEGESCTDDLVAFFTSKDFNMMPPQHKKPLLSVIRKLPYNAREKITKKIRQMQSLRHRGQYEETKRALTQILADISKSDATRSNLKVGIRH